MTYTGHALQWPGGTGMSEGRAWAKIVGLFVGGGLIIGAIGYPITAVILKNRQQVRKAAAEINALVAPSETIYAVDPDYQPVFFYVKAPLKYVSDVEELPADAHYFVVQSDKETEATTTPHWAPRRAYLRTRLRDYRNRELLLFEVGSK
jgi:hypothetical protein